MLRSNQDAYGHQLYDFFKGRQVIEVVERDDGLIDPSEVLPKYYLSEYMDWDAAGEACGTICEGQSARHRLRRRTMVPLSSEERP